MTHLTKLSRIDGTEWRVTVEATVASTFGIDHPHLVEKGPVRDGSQNCSDEDAVHVLLESSAARAQLKAGKKYRFGNVRTNYVAVSDREWGPQMQIVIDDESDVTVIDSDSSNADESTSHSPTRGTTSNQFIRGGQNSDLIKDLGLNRGGL